jgi:hypothetical protein
MRRNALIGACVILAGCQSMDGTKQLIRSSGVVQNTRDFEGKRPSDNLALNFQLAVQTAANDSKAVPDMVDAGVALVRTNCDDYFVQAGSLQRGSQVSRDMLAPIVTALTALVALRDFSTGKKDDFLRIVTIGSSATIAGLDIVDKRFLFGAENIQSVRNLTFKALETHREGMKQQGNVNFTTGVALLIDHQGVCTPSNILDLTKRAIAAGQPTTKSIVPAQQTSDMEALFAIGQAAGLRGAATPDQAGALWWMYVGGASDDELQIVGPKLNAMGPSLSPMTQATGAQTYSFMPGRIDSRMIVAALDQLSSETKRAFAAEVSTYQADQAKRGPAAASPKFTLGSPAGVTHIPIVVE